jgi:signal peptidase I
VREYAETLLICVLFVVYARAFVVQQSEIPSGSMEDTILVGDHVLVDRFLYAPTQLAWERTLLPIREVRRGDIVVFKHPLLPELDYIKRVAALPGETVELRDGQLLVDGRAVPEPYLRPEDRVVPPFGPVRVQPDHYFVLGDNRSRSSDSRSWGLVPADLIKGRAVLVLFSTQGRSEPGETPGQVTLRSLARKLVDLVFHARWDRFFRPVR